jgi:hypothetical protein
MKLSRADAVNLNNLLSTVALGGIDAIVIENGLASGLNNKNAVFISDVDVPSFGQKIGLSRLNLLRQRLDLLVNNPDITIDAKESDRGEITQLEIVAGKTKVQFRCTSTALIKAPKKLNDEAVALISVKKEQLQLILNSVKVMGAKQITLSIKKDGKVFFDTADSNNDRMTIELDDLVERVGDGLVDEDELETIVHYYNTDILSTLFRTAATEDGVSFTVGGAGTINLLVHGHSMYVFSQIDGDD